MRPQLRGSDPVARVGAAVLSIDVITIFPEMFTGVLDQSILRIAREKGAVEYRLCDLREFTDDRHRSVDDRPFGGGPGMVMKIEPMARAVRSLRASGPKGRLLLTTPQGRRFDQAFARELADADRLILIAGHYEGYDERIRTVLEPEEVSIGDFVLTGGELPAMVIIDSVVRLLDGVLGSAESLNEESFALPGRLEYPHYTRPRSFEGEGVPEILLSGNHQAIAAWREEQAILRTRERRPESDSPPLE
jgi:tRNA (guanine37-N1)-methyltransferase